MSVIWKRKIEGSKTTYDLPKFAEVLCVQVQNGEPHIWFVCDPEQAQEKRAFSIVGTGHKFDVDRIEKYIGTFQLNGGQLVFHLFEIVID